jgi:di/tricarboxylate transporter
MAVLVFTRLRSDVVFLGAVGILFLTGVLDSTQAFSGILNSSVIVLMFRIVYAATASLGLPLLPYAIALLLSVNSAFMTLVSTPLNLLVYGPGGYTAKDYLRIGLPLKLVYLATTIITVYFFYDI